MKLKSFSVCVRHTMTLSAQELRTTVETVLGDKQLNENARELQNMLQLYDGCKNSAQLMSELLD